MTPINKSNTSYLDVRATSGLEKVFTFEYVQVPLLPAGTTNENIFRRAIQDSSVHDLKTVLNDLYRFLVFSNYARFNGNLTDRYESLRQLDIEYPYAGKLVEASMFNATWHQSSATNTTGAVLYLLIHSRNTVKVNETLGGVLVSMLNHRKYRKELPRIDAET